MDSPFHRWVSAHGGAEKLAKELGVTAHAVRWWLRRQGWPNVKVMIEIVRLSKGKLSFNDIIAACKPRTTVKRGQK